MKLTNFLRKVESKGTSTYYFSGDKMEIYIPRNYFDKKFATPFGATIKSIGLFMFKVFPTEESKEGKLYELQLPVPISFRYSDETKKTLSLKKGLPTMEYVIYTLYHNDIFLTSDQYVLSVHDLLNFISRMLHNGQLPATTEYSDLMTIYSHIMTLTDAKKLGTPSVIFEAMLSEMCRDKVNVAKPYRLVYDEKKAGPLDYKYVKLTKVPELVSSFSGITSEDVRHQIVAGILRTKENKKDVISPVEMVLKL